MPEENEVLKETLATETPEEGKEADASSVSKEKEETLLDGANEEKKIEDGDSEDKPAEGDKEEPKEGGEEEKSESKKGTITDGKYTVDDYEIVVPEGQEFNSELLDSIVPVFQDLGLENDSVQKIVDGYSEAVKAHVGAQIQKSMDHYETITEGWKKSALKELGADSSKKLGIAAVARDKLGDSEFKEMLKETGVGNHPAMIRMLIKAGKLIKEDSFPDPGQPNKGRADSPEKVLYPTMNQ